MYRIRCTAFACAAQAGSVLAVELILASAAGSFVGSLTSGVKKAKK